MFDVIVIGKGLIGSAAARSLSTSTSNIAIIGPDEPEDLATHDGIFASHYDQGRITRILDEDLVWGTLAQRAIAQYAQIEQESGISFHHSIGAMRVGHNTPDQISYIINNRRVGETLGATFQEYTYDDLKERFPYCSFASDAIALYETGGAGFVNPRALIRAQLHIAKRRGVTILREIVKKLSVDSAVCTLQTRNGNTYTARKVLITTGGFTNFFSLVGRPLNWKVVAEPILLAELSSDSERAIAHLPSLMYRVPMEEGYMPAYLIPPVEYPDGKRYLKIGIGNQRNIIFDSLESITAWFKTGPDEATHQRLQDTLLTILPRLEIVSSQAKPCVLTLTTSNYPYIDVVKEKQVYLAVGGCGYAGKSAVEIGYIGAQLTLHNEWSYDLDARNFKASF